jgi:hypothetical protein
MTDPFPLSAAGLQAGQADHLSLREEPARARAAPREGAAAACGPSAAAAHASSEA